MTGVRRRLREALVIFAQTFPVFAIISYFSSLEKGLVATMALFSIWTAVTARWEGRHTAGFWWLVALIVIANAVAIWLLPISQRFPSGMAVAYPLGMIEGFLVYWLLGWWTTRSTNVG